MGSGTAVGGFIGARGRTKRFERNEPIFHEGDPSDSVYVVLSGRVKIVVTAPSGRELLLGVLERGRAFGELSAIDGGARSAGAIATTETVVATMTGQDFLDGLHDEPGVAVDVLVHLAEQLRLSNVRLTARNSDRAADRVAARLLELSRLMIRHGSCRPDHVEIELSQSDLANWVGTTRESTARALSELRKAGIVSTSRGRIVIHDVDALAAV